MKNYAIIPSGGKGLRSGEPFPKQYKIFCGKELIAYTIAVFQNCEEIDEIIIAAKEDFFPLLNEIKSKYKFDKIKKLIPGGSERQHSVFNALKSIAAGDDDLVAVHDAVRPLLSQSVLKNALNSAKIFDNVVTGIRAKDTLIKGNDSVEEYIDRQEIFYAQTPQIFRYRILLDAMQKAEKENYIGTDESMLVKRASYNVKIVEGSSLNFKITTPDDLRLFELICENNITK